MIELDDLYKRYPSAVPADHFNLTIEDGEFFTLLGPSGSGKSTILRMIAGLESPDSGRIAFRGKDITGMAPWQRGFGMVFQHYAIFPHLNVGENIQYGLTRQQRAEHGKARAEELLELVGLPGYAGRKVHQLSGGEQQRVAIARALAPKPPVLLLDEPLSALDEKIRREMQIELRDIQRKTGTTFVYVTHDQEEALTMSDRIALLNQGKCVQCDEPHEVFQRPRTVFAANFFRGCNIIDAVPFQHEGQAWVQVAGQRLPVPPAQQARFAGKVAIRSENVVLQADAQGAEATAVVEKIVYRGMYNSVLVRLDDGQTVTCSTTQVDGLGVGQAVLLQFQATDVIFLE